MRIIVIGGGIAGLTSAAALSQYHHITLIERDAVLQGASAASTGLLLPPARSSRHPLALLGRAAAERYPAWVRDLEQHTGMEVGYCNPGAIRILDNTDLRATQQPQGIPTPGAHIDPTRLLAALRMQIQQRDGRIVTAAITGLIHERGRVRGVWLDAGQRIMADHVVIAAGVESTRLCRPLGIQIPLVAEPGQIVQVCDVPHMPEQIIMDDQRVAVAKNTILHIAGGASVESTLEWVRRQFGGGRLHTIWQQVRPHMPSNRNCPLIRPVAPGASVVTGHGKNGYLLAPLTGALLADAIAA